MRALVIMSDSDKDCFSLQTKNKTSELNCSECLIVRDLNKAEKR